MTGITYTEGVNLNIMSMFAKTQTSQISQQHPGEITATDAAGLIETAQKEAMGKLLRSELRDTEKDVRPGSIIAIRGATAAEVGERAKEDLKSAGVKDEHTLALVDRAAQGAVEGSKEKSEKPSAELGITAPVAGDISHTPRQGFVKPTSAESALEKTIFSVIEGFQNLVGIELRDKGQIRAAERAEREAA